MKIDWELVITVMACLVIFEVANVLFLGKAIAGLKKSDEGSYEE